MASSGSVNYSITRDNLISAALRKIGVLGEGDTPTTDQITEAAEELNMMVKFWQVDGLQLWARKYATVFLEKNKSEYKIGPGGDHAASSYVETTVATASGTALTVGSATGISSSDNIGIVLDDGEIHWDTVSGSPSGKDITLSTGIPSAASSGNAVYSYASKIDRPLRIIYAVRRNKDNQDIPVSIISQEQYNALPNKSSDGKVVEIYYDPKYEGGDPATATGSLFVWSQTDDVTDSLEIIYHRPFEDFDAATDTPDFPQEWYLPLMYNLASILADTYDINQQLRSSVNRKAIVFKQQALDFDQEWASIYFQPKDIR